MARGGSFLDQLTNHSTELITAIRNSLGDPLDLASETLQDGRISVIYLSYFIDKSSLQNNFINPVNQLKSLKFNWDEVLGAIAESGRIRRDNFEEVLSDLLNGYVLVHLNGEKTVYTFDAHQDIKRPPTKPLIERTIRGAKISLLENISDNIHMVRKAIKNKELRVEGFKIGERSQTNVGMVYLNDVAEPEIVDEVRQRLTKISIDGIVDSGYIEQLITDNGYSAFPLTQSTERPDKMVAGVLEGRVGIFVDGSSNGIIVPVTVNELYQSPEDYYFTIWFGSFLRAFRILGNIISVSLPGVYIALTAVNPELLPTRFALAIAGSRMGVAFPILIELLAMETVMEIFREGSLRLPTTVSQTLGVTAGIVLGIAAVGAGLVSNATLVVVIITAIASYSGPNYEIGLSWRIFKFALIIAGAILGVLGITLAGFAILIHAAVQNSFTISYLAPWAPPFLIGLNDTIIRRPIWQKRRSKTYRPANIFRFRSKG